MTDLEISRLQRGSKIRDYRMIFYLKMYIAAIEILHVLRYRGPASIDLLRGKGLGFGYLEWSIWKDGAIK